MAGRSAKGLSVSGGVLPATPPFDFGLTLEFLRRFEPMAGEQTVTDGTLTKALRLPGRTVVFGVSAATDAGPGVEYTIHSEGPLAKASEQEAQARIAFFLSLDDDLEPFYEMARSDPPMARAVRRLRGLHQVKFLTPFENAAWAVLAQRVTVPMARLMKRALIDRYGSTMEVGGVPYLAFPRPEDLAAATETELAQVIRNRVRARGLAAVAEAFGAVEEEWLRTSPYQEVEGWLRSIPGIGPWSAAFVLFRGLGRIEQMPLTPPMMRAARALYGASATDQDLRAAADRYGPWSGYWSMYSRAAS